MSWLPDAYQAVIDSHRGAVTRGGVSRGERRVGRPCRNPAEGNSDGRFLNRLATSSEISSSLPAMASARFQALAGQWQTTRCSAAKNPTLVWASARECRRHRYDSRYSPAGLAAAGRTSNRGVPSYRVAVRDWCGCSTAVSRRSVLKYAAAAPLVLGLGTGASGFAEAPSAGADTSLVAELGAPGRALNIIGRGEW